MKPYLKKILKATISGANEDSWYKNHIGLELNVITTNNQPFNSYPPKEYECTMTKRRVLTEHLIFKENS